MKKLLLLPLLLSFQFAYAGTGGANDEVLFLLAICVVLLFILVVLYSIDFFRKIIKQRKENKMAQPDEKPGSEEKS